jgi:hypothetical protein
MLDCLRFSGLAAKEAAENTRTVHLTAKMAFPTVLKSMFALVTRNSTHNTDVLTFVVFFASTALTMTAIRVPTQQPEESVQKDAEPSASKTEVIPLIIEFS